MTEPFAMVLNQKQEDLSEHKETLFHCDGDRAPAQIAQRGCRVAVFSYIKHHLGMVLLFMALLEQGVQPAELQRLLSSSTITWLWFLSNTMPVLSSAGTVLVVMQCDDVSYYNKWQSYKKS